MYTMWAAIALQGLARRPTKLSNFNLNPFSFSFRSSRTAVQFVALAGIYCMYGHVLRGRPPHARGLLQIKRPMLRGTAVRPKTPAQKLCCTSMHDTQRHVRSRQLQSSCVPLRASRDRCWPRQGFIAIH